MKFTQAWLKEHLDTKASVEKIADTLTRIGLEVEGIFDPATKLAPFKVAEVVKCEKHPNADKLSVCEVDTGKERLQVVCGAPNALARLRASTNRKKTRPSRSRAAFQIRSLSSSSSTRRAPTPARSLPAGSCATSKKGPPPTGCNGGARRGAL